MTFDLVKWTKNMDISNIIGASMIISYDIDYYYPVYLILNHDSGCMILMDISTKVDNIDQDDPWEIGRFIYYGMIKDMNDPYGYVMGFNCMPFFMYNHKGLYNSILNRIEDLYGMSIDEFSLGMLSYE